MANWTVRSAVLDDHETIVDFNQTMALDTEGKTLDRPTLSAGVQRLLEEPRLGRYFVVEDAGEVVGQLMLTEEWSDWRCGRFLWIQSVYVAPTHRRRGVYRALHAHVAEEAAREADVCGVRLYVELDNGGAQQTYAQMGMRECDYRMFEQTFAGD